MLFLVLLALLNHALAQSEKQLNHASKQDHIHLYIKKERKKKNRSTTAYTYIYIIEIMPRLQSK